jgi:hypothetical protein
MSDFIFVVKCFIYTLVIAFLMQIKVSGISIEARAEHYLKGSQLTEYLQDASRGGARLLQDGYSRAKDFVSDSTRAFREQRTESQESRASRR